MQVRGIYVELAANVKRIDLDIGKRAVAQTNSFNRVTIGYKCG